MTGSDKILLFCMLVMFAVIGWLIHGSEARHDWQAACIIEQSVKLGAAVEPYCRAQWRLTQ